MKLRASLIILSFFSCLAYSQDVSSTQNDNSKYTRKGKFYIFYGWNVSTYSTSDMRFKGSNFDFTLYDVVAKDRPSPFTVDKYFNAKNITIPQYDFRLGYYFKDNYDISFGIDHMKYVVQQNQEVEISGSISETGTSHDGTYSNELKTITRNFLQFEHTDGLNYVNIDIRRTDDILKSENLTISLIEGLTSGVVVPKSDVTLLSNERSDKFHWAGYGLGAVVGLNFTFFKHFFIQTEGKGGYINLPNVRVSKNNSSDRASHAFKFGQFNVVIGSKLNFKKNKKSPK